MLEGALVKILLLGSDGYLGFPLCCNLADRGHEVVGVDNLTRRRLVSKVGGKSVTKIYEPHRRSDVVNEKLGDYKFVFGDVTDYDFLKQLIQREDPDAIANLAHIPSAPYSMMSQRTAWETQRNNILGNLNLMHAVKEQLPESLDYCMGVEGRSEVPHILQIATLGEYPIMDGPIPEGTDENGLPVQKDPGSLYHASKVNMTVNSYFLSKVWDEIRVTEVYQGPVYGVSMFEDISRELVTRFDVDDVFGTVLNRFTAQGVVGHPLTVYGRGGQKRGFLSIKDSIQCLTLALEKPPEESYRPINQFHKCYRVNELAEIISDLTGADIEHIENPRVEDESDHPYELENDNLKELGYESVQPMEDEIKETVSIIEENKYRIREDTLTPNVKWK